MNVGNRVGLASLVVAALGGSAFAADHLLKVNEVLLSQNGSTANQFIELEDTGESFPDDPYFVTIYDATGTTMVGEQSFEIAAGTTRFTLATAGARTAFGLTLTDTAGTTPVIDLTVALPANGVACFRKDGQLIHCMAWGTVASIPTGPGVNPNTGESPPDGMSLQRKGNNCASVATPTPNATNSSPACGPGDAGMTGDASMPADASDTVDAGNNNSGSDGGGCASSGPSGVGLLGLAGVLFGVRGMRRRTKRQR
jgi:uncharacterized protein (TIGR03382 family)